MSFPTEQLYTGDEYSRAGINTTLENCSPNLQRLPSPSVNEVRYDVFTQSHFRTPAIDPSSLDSRAQKYKAIDPHALVPLTDARMVLKSQQAVAGPGKDDLFQGSASKPEEALFFKVLSTKGTTISKSFLPPALPQVTRNPIISSERANHNGGLEDIDDDGDDDDFYGVPTGDWTSPVVKAALQRQVNKERIFRRLWRNVTRLFFFHLSLLLIDYAFNLYRVRYYDENTKYRNDFWVRLASRKSAQYVQSALAGSYVHVGHLQWVFVAAIVVNLAKLLWPQDQCKDLPLTGRQRELIGLKPLDTDESEDGKASNLIIKQRLFESTTAQPLHVPQYAKVNELSGYIRRTEQPGEDDATALKDILPPRRLVHSHKAGVI